MGKLYTLAVGQGDFAVLVGDTEAIVIDTHLPSKTLKNTIFIKRALGEIAKNKNLVGVILTGFDADHAEPEGVGMVLKRFNASWVLYPKYYKGTQTADAVFKVIGDIESEKGNKFGRISVTMKNMGRPPVGRAVIADLFLGKSVKKEPTTPPLSFVRKKPPAPTSLDSLNGYSKDFSFVAFSPYLKDETTSNNASLVIKITERTTQRSILVTGDTEGVRWDEICKYQSEKLKSDILQAPHHGSKNGITKKAFNFICPNTVIISAGKDNQYGHPDKEALEIFNEKADYYSTHQGSSWVTYFDLMGIKTEKYLPTVGG